MLRHFADKPLAYLTIPVVAAGVGYTTNLAGVKMLFYPLEYVGAETGVPTTMMVPRLQNVVAGEPDVYVLAPFRARPLDRRVRTRRFFSSGVDLYRPPLSPYGVFGWQGVVPTKAEKMAQCVSGVDSQVVSNLSLSRENRTGGAAGWCSERPPPPPPLMVKKSEEDDDDTGASS